MRALILLTGGALLLASCETAFVGEAPGGRYALVEVDGNPLPYTADPRHHCPTRIEGGHFDLDALARRFEMAIDRDGPCSRPDDIVERGSYLRRGGRLELEAAAPGGTTRTLVATESGNMIAIDYDRLRLRFRRVAPPR